MNNEELSQAPAEVAAEAPAAAEVCAAPEAPAADDEKANDGVERWHAVTADGLLSAHTKNELKKKLRAVPAASLAAIIRGKKVSLQTSVSF